MVKKILLLFLSWKIIVLIFALVAPRFFSVPQNQWRYLGNTLYPNAPYLEWIWANFDGVRYLEIAKNGYAGFNFAYFPLLPWTVGFLQKIFSTHFLETALVACNLAFLISLFVVYKIALLDYNKKIALKTLFFLLIFPVSFYYGAVYTESFYFLLATLSFYCARKSNWVLAGIFGYIAGLSRFVGVALFPALIIEWLSQNQLTLKSFFKTKGYFIFLTLMGVVTYGLFLQLKHGDFFLFQKALSDWKQDKFVFPVLVVWNYIKNVLVFPEKFRFTYWVMNLELFSTFCYFALAIYALRKVRLSYGVFMLVSLMIPICTGALESMPRYILHLFPAFLALAILLGKNKFIFRLTLLIFLVLSFIFVSLFTRGYFIG